MDPTEDVAVALMRVALGWLGAHRVRQSANRVESLPKSVRTPQPADRPSAIRDDWAGSEDEERERLERGLGRTLAGERRLLQHHHTYRVSSTKFKTRSPGRSGQLLQTTNPQPTSPTKPTSPAHLNNSNQLSVQNCFEPTEIMSVQNCYEPKNRMAPSIVRAASTTVGHVSGAGVPSVPSMLLCL